MDELKELLGELYGDVAERLGNKRLVVDDGRLIPKHRFDCVNVSLKEHKAELERLRQEHKKLCGELAQTLAFGERVQRCERENAALTRLLIELLPYKLSAETEAKQ